MVFRIHGIRNTNNAGRTFPRVGPFCFEMEFPQHPPPYLRATSRGNMATASTNAAAEASTDDHVALRDVLCGNEGVEGWVVDRAKGSKPRGAEGRSKVRNYGETRRIVLISNGSRNENFPR